MPKLRVNISIDEVLHAQATSILNFTGLTFSAFIEQSVRELVSVMTPVIESSKKGKNLQAFAHLQLAAAKNQQAVTEGLSELSEKFYEQVSAGELILPERIAVHKKKPTAAGRKVKPAK